MRQLRAMYGVKQGIALTGHTSWQDEKDCGEAGFTRFLPKPVSFRVLLTELQRLLPPPGPAAERSGSGTEAIITRLGVMRKRSEQLLVDMTQLQEDFRQHTERNAQSPQPPFTATPDA